MANIKKFDEFVKESTQNKGKGVGGDTDLFSRPSPKQTTNRGDLNPLDNLGIRGRQITTEKIDGIVKSVKDGIVYVEDRLTKEMKEFPVTDFLKEFYKSYKKEKKEAEKKEPKVEESAKPKLDEKDKEFIDKLIYDDKINETKEEKEIWEKKWENFATNYVKAVKELKDDAFDDASSDKPVNENVPEDKCNFGVFAYYYDGMDDINIGEYNNYYLNFVIAKNYAENLVEPLLNDHKDFFIEVWKKPEDGLWGNSGEPEFKIEFKDGKEVKSIEENKEEQKLSIKIERFADFSRRIRIKPNSIDEENNTEEIIDENAVPKQVPQIKCSECKVEVDDNERDKVRHLYSKHNFKPSIDNIDDWLLKYFPPKIDDKKKK